MIDRTPDLPAIMNQVQSRVNEGRFFAAISLLEKLPVAATSTPEVVYTLASLLMRVRRWENAEILLAELLEALPGRAVFVFDQAQCLIELGRLSEAAALLNSAPPDVKKRFPRQVLLARIAVIQGDDEAGVQHLAKALWDGPPALAMAMDYPELIPLLAPFVESSTDR